jgi:hypothetical protein
MTIRKSDGRHLIQLTMAPALYFELRDHCQKLDTPITVWARNLIRRALADAAPIDDPDRLDQISQDMPKTP